MPGFKQAVKKERPGWWTPEGVLERLNNGVLITVICAAASEELKAVGVEVAPSTLRRDVAKWNESATWGELFTAALALWKRTSSGEMALSREWHDDFIAAMDVCEGNARNAAELIGIGYGIVLAVTDKRNRCYDKEFHERFRVAETARVAAIREQYYQTAEKNEGKLGFRAKERIIETALPGLHGQKQEVHHSGLIGHAHDHDHRHQHLHLHAMTSEQVGEVARSSQERMRRITAGRERALPAAATTDPERVIDIDRAELRGKVEAVFGSRGVAALEGAIEEAMDKAMPIIRESVDATGSVKPS